MIPLKPENLTSTTTSSKRRSYHWVFDKHELDISIDPNTIWIQTDNANLIAGLKCEKRFFGYEYPHLINWIQNSPKAVNIISWFGNTTLFMDFLVAEHQEIVNPEQHELDL